jgi:hypothetical protein
MPACDRLAVGSGSVTPGRPRGHGRLTVVSVRLLVLGLTTGLVGEALHLDAVGGGRLLILAGASMAAGGLVCGGALVVARARRRTDLSDEEREWGQGSDDWRSPARHGWRRSARGPARPSPEHSSSDREFREWGEPEDSWPERVQPERVQSEDSWPEDSWPERVQPERVQFPGVQLAPGRSDAEPSYLPRSQDPCPPSPQQPYPPTDRPADQRPVPPGHPSGPRPARLAAPQADEVRRIVPRYAAAPRMNAVPGAQPARGPDSPPEHVRSRSWFEATPRPQGATGLPSDVSTGRSPPSGPAAGPPPLPPPPSAEARQRPAPAAPSLPQPSPALASPPAPPATVQLAGNGSSPRQVDPPDPRPMNPTRPQPAYWQEPGPHSQPETFRQGSFDRPRSVTTGQDALDDTCPLPVILPDRPAPRPSAWVPDRPAFSPARPTSAETPQSAAPPPPH